MDRPSFARRRFFLLVLILWALASAALLALRWHAIGAEDFLDVDDQLRLVQVRDWLGGQSFHDVTQYRMNQPAGAPMHWSRLLDLPLAGMMLILRPFVGTASAQIIAAAVIPLLTLGTIMLLAGLTARRLAGVGAGLAASLFCAICMPILLQTTPLRVDHHGWEIALSMLALFAGIDRDSRRSGIVAGVAIATALQISLEALPFAAAIGALFGLRWVLDPSPEQRSRLTAFAGSLLACQALLFVLLHAPREWTMAYCDAVSAAQIAAIAVSTLGVLGLVRSAPGQLVLRLAGIAVIGLLAIAAYHAFPPYCGLDAFSGLEPMVRKLWYERVLEGLPVWQLPPLLVISTIGFPIVGLICAGFGWRSADAGDRQMWGSYFLLLLGAVGVAVMVQRSGAFANAAATPATAWMLMRLAPRMGKSRSPLIRIVGTAVVGFLLSPVGLITVAAAVTDPDPDAIQETRGTQVRSCNSTESIRGLNVLSPSRLLSPLDLGPSILLQTGHGAVASGHHRNHAAMNDVIIAFTGNEATAHAIVKRRGIDFVVICATTSEMKVYRKYAPGGFAAQLTAKRPPAWLEPVVLKDNPLQVWRVRN